MSEDRNYTDLLHARWAEGKFVCVGLDSAEAKLPKSAPDQLVFNRQIVDATHDIVAAYKPNLAFYRGQAGKEKLRLTIECIKKFAPDVPVILDAKYGDIGNTNDGYVAEAFDYFGADAVTISPYLGFQAMKPFLDRADKGIIILCRTSNPGSDEFQGRKVEISEEKAIDMGLESPSAPGEVVYQGGSYWAPLYQLVAHQIATTWNYNGNCSAVFGATYADELAKTRPILKNIPILIPGIGAQGGNLFESVTNGQNKSGQGFLINNSRGVIFASSEVDFAPAARQVVINMNTAITAALAA